MSTPLFVAGNPWINSDKELNHLPLLADGLRVHTKSCPIPNQESDGILALYRIRRVIG
jgi:hypothetical protein